MAKIRKSIQQRTFLATCRECHGRGYVYQTTHTSTKTYDSDSTPCPVCNGLGIKRTTK